MLKRVVTVVLIVGIIGIIVYDVSRYATAQRSLRNATYDLATWAAQNADTMNRDQVAAQLVPMAEAKGVVVYQYGQSDRSVQVWAETTVGGTLVVGTVRNLFAGMPFSEATQSDFTIQDYREAGIQ